MDRALGLAAASRRVQEERRVVRRGRRRRKSARNRFHPFRPLQAADSARARVFLPHDHNLCLRSLPRRRKELVQNARMDDGDPRAAIGQVVRVVRCPRHRVHRHGHRADFSRAEKRRNEFRRVRQDNQDAVAALHPRRKQRIARAVG